MNYFRIKPADDINAFVIYVKTECKLSILRRIDQDVILNAGDFTDTL